MRIVEQQMLASGWNRCPNNSERWYAGHAGKLQPAYPMQIRVTDEIWLVAKLYGGVDQWARLMRFDTISALERYCERSGVHAEALAPFSNSWD